MKLRAISLFVLLLFSAAPAFSQGCAMCASSARASKGGQKAIAKGVAVLLIPPLGFMTLGVGLAAWYARRRDLER
jgi:hypothetical protein